MTAFTASRPEYVASAAAFATISIMAGRRPSRGHLDGLCLAIARGDDGLRAVLAYAGHQGLL